MISGDKDMSATETDAVIIRNMSINIAIIAGVLLGLVYASYAIAG